MSKNVKPVNPMKVITGPETRWSYANVWEPKSINGGTPKYSVSLIIPKSDTRTVAKIKAAIELPTRKAKQLKGNGKTVPALSVLKTLFVTAIERPDDAATPMPTSSTPTLPLLPALWTQTVILS